MNVACTRAAPAAPALPAAGSTHTAQLTASLGCACDLEGRAAGADETCALLSLWLLEMNDITVTAVKKNG